ncbi:MAG: toll/interleukin-1 receptor domain-containing protein [Desulfobacterales bacterium]|nr:toll/interleukin-1 receptor domain-containing protein [Desulfobacterales bacterium]
MKTKKIPLILSAYFILTLLIWMVIRENDWFFYKYTLDFLKKPELSNDVVLVDISYPNRLGFRKNVGLFLQKMAELPEKPLSVGLDIIFRKFEPSTLESEESTLELIKGVNSLTDKGIPVIAGYNPQEKKDFYDKKLMDNDSPFTDIGHNIVRTRDGKFHARVFEPIESDSKIGKEIMTFFAVLTVKYNYYKDSDNYLNRLKKYNNILPIRYQKKFQFKTYHFPGEKASGKIFHNNHFAGKTVLIGNFKKDYKEGIHGLHAIGYAVQMLINQDNGEDILIEFEDNIWKILFIVIFFSFVEVCLFNLIFYLFKKLNKELILCISYIFSFALFLVFVWVMLRFSYLFADVTIVLSGIIASGGICFYCREKFQANPEDIEDVPSGSQVQHEKTHDEIASATPEPEPCDTGKEQEIKVFISYADEDRKDAEKLCDNLKQSRVIPWMRARDILPGQNYKEAIRQAIKTSSLFLAMFSSNSVSKKGIVHRELKMVKDLAGERTLSEIFIIPVRLDDCDLNDEELEALRGVDLFQSYENGLEQISRVINQDAIKGVPK